MDDRNPSPPTSKKSSAISKTDFVEAPHMSPYRTRSRKNSNLTEENIAVHNESPITRNSTRRVTRRMSQGSENATITLTPVPTAGKRTRRSPSVASDGASGVVAKPKFTLTQENVVLEEDELLEESKSQSQIVIENGSSQKVDKDEVSEMEVDSTMIESKPNDSNKIVSDAGTDTSRTFNVTSNLKLVGIQPTLKLNKINFPQQMEMITEKSEESANTTKVESSIAPVSEPVSAVNTKSSDISASAETEAKSEQSTTSNLSTVATTPLSHIPEVSTKSTTGAKKLVRTSSRTLRDTPSRSSTESPIFTTPKSQRSVLPVTPCSVVLAEPTKSQALNTPKSQQSITVTPSTAVPADIVIVPDTPLKPSPEIQNPSKTVPEENQESMDVSVSNETPSKIGETSLEIGETQPEIGETPSKIRETPSKIVETPSKIVPVDMDVSVLTKEISTKTSPVAMDVSVLATPVKTLANILPVNMDVSETPPKISNNPSNTVSVDMDVSVLNKETPPKLVPVDMDVSVALNKETPLKTPVLMGVSASKIATPTKTPSKISTVDMDVAELNKAEPGDTEVSVPNEEASLKNVPMELSVTNQETTTEATNTPAKTELAEKQDSDQGTPSKTDPNSEPLVVSESNQLTPSKTEPLENGTTGVVEEYAKFGGSIHRKSDGKPIDTFGLNEKVAETTTSTIKKYGKNKSIINIQDSSDGSDEEDDDSPQNEFLDNEAMDTNGESSMDEEERKYLEENEIPTDGISLGSDTEDEISDSGASNDSFIVSDSSVALLDGSGDDLESENEKSTLNTSKGKPKRGNKIFDTSEDEAAIENLDEKPKKINLKRRSDTMPNSTQVSKRLSLHPNTKLNSGKLKVAKEPLAGDSSFDEMETENIDKQQNKVDDSSDDDVAIELANLDAKPSTRSASKRLSDTKPLSKKDTKRMSLHPNTILNELIEEEDNSSVSVKEIVIVSDSSEADVANELANLDSEPKKGIASKRLSGAALSKKDTKRMSLHPNTKLNSFEASAHQADESIRKAFDVLVQNTSTMDEEEVDNAFNAISLNPTDFDKTITPKKVAASKRLSKSLSKKDETLTEKDEVDESKEEDIAEELANLDAEPKKITASKRLSESMTRSKKDMKRMSLHANAKLNCDGLESNENQNNAKLADTNTNLPNGIDEMDIEQSTTKPVAAPSTSKGQPKVVTFNFEEIQAKCDDILNLANEAKRGEKLKNKAELEEEKYLKLKEKKQKKLQEKKTKETRKLEREVLAAEQRRLKKLKKIKPNDITEDEKAKAIQKALSFSEKVKANKILHSIETKIEMPNDTKEGKNATTAVKTNRKRKILSILDDARVSKKMKPTEPSQLPAKPEGFAIHSKPIQKPKNLKLRRDKAKVIISIENTTAGIFEVQNVPKKASPFTVTSLECSRPFSFSNFKDTAILNANVKRETAAELLSRKQRQKALQKQ